MNKNGLLGGDLALVSFELPAAVSASTATLCGDFNDWSPNAEPLTRLEDGGFRAVVELPTGRHWRFRYLLDGHRWENDWGADHYVPNDFGTHDSVVDLTTGVPPAPPPEPVEVSEPTAAPEPADAVGPAKESEPAEQTSPAAPVVEVPGRAKARPPKADANTSSQPPKPRARKSTAAKSDAAAATPGRRRKSTKSAD